MDRVRLEILPWVSDAFGGEGSGDVVLEEELTAGGTIGDVIKKLASENQTFSDFIFTDKPGELSGQVTIILNDRLLETVGGLDTNLNNGDIIRLFPVIAGG